jgi:hypothetical protein
MPRGITHVPENRSPSSDCRIPPLSGPHRFNSVVGSRARSIARPRLISPSGQPCSVCAGSVPIKEQRRLTWRVAGPGRARRVSTVTATRCSHPPDRTVRAHDYRIAQLVRSEVGAMHQRGMATPPSLSRRIVIHTHEDRPPETVESHRVTHVSTQTTRGTMCLLLNSSTANWLPVTLGCPYLVTHGSLVGQHVQALLPSTPATIASRHVRELHHRRIRG